MCESNAYIIDENGEEMLFLEIVDILKPREDGNIYLRNYWGEEKIFRGVIKEISLLNHKIVLKSS